MGRSGANAEPLNTILALVLSGHLGMTSPDMTLKIREIHNHIIYTHLPRLLDDGASFCTVWWLACK